MAAGLLRQKAVWFDAHFATELVIKVRGELMEALEKAKLTMEFAGGADVNTHEAAYFYNKAHSLASIAQAEQLKRIADSLEKLTQTIEESNS